MKPDGKSIFREIAKGLPPEQQTVFWEMVAHLEKLPPDDEILRLCQAMGVLTLVTQKIPSELAAQREAWQETCTAFRNELRAALQKAQEQSTAMTNQVAGLAQDVGATGQLVARNAEKVEEAMRQGADGFSTEKLARDVRAKMETTILKPTEEVVQKSAETVQRFEKSVPRFEGVLDRLENFNYQTAWCTAFIVCGVAAILLVGVIWLRLDRWYNDSLTDEVRQIDARTADNEVVVKALNDLGKPIYVYPKDGKYILVLPDASDTWISTTHAGVIQFVPSK
jgi:hypothetical protein